MSHNTFESWFEEPTRSNFICNDIQCSFSDPFKRKEVVKKWLKMSWESGYSSAQTKIKGEK